MLSSVTLFNKLHMAKQQFILDGKIGLMIPDSDCPFGIFKLFLR